MKKPLADDTPFEVEERQIEAWRRMTPAQKAATVGTLSKGVRELALGGIRQRHPGASPREQFLRLAIITLGHDLAARAYPEVAQLDL